MKTSNTIPLWINFNNALDRLEADRSLNFINQYPFTAAMASPLIKNTEMMKVRVAMIKSLCQPEPNSIIEFGGAYGNLGATYLETNPLLEYTLVDTESMLKFSKVFFDVKGKKATFVKSSDIEEAIKEYDLFCTYCAISETPEEYQYKVFETFLPKCKSAMIIEIPDLVPKYSSILEGHYEDIKILDAPPGHSDKHMIIFATNRRK